MGSQKSIAGRRAPEATGRLAAWLVAVAVACIGLLPALHGWQHQHSPTHVHAERHCALHAPCHHARTDHQASAHESAQHDAHGHHKDGTRHDGERDTEHECTTCIQLKLATGGLLTIPAATLDGPARAPLLAGIDTSTAPIPRSLSTRSSRGPPRRA